MDGNTVAYSKRRKIQNTFIAKASHQLEDDLDRRIVGMRTKLEILRDLHGIWESKEKMPIMIHKDYDRLMQELNEDYALILKRGQFPLDLLAKFGETMTRANILKSTDFINEKIEKDRSKVDPVVVVDLVDQDKLFWEKNILERENELLFKHIVNDPEFSKYQDLISSSKLRGQAALVKTLIKDPNQRAILLKKINQQQLAVQKELQKARMFKQAQQFQGEFVEQAMIAQEQPVEREIFQEEIKRDEQGIERPPVVEEQKQPMISTYPPFSKWYEDRDLKNLLINIGEKSKSQTVNKLMKQHNQLFQFSQIDPIFQNIIDESKQSEDLIESKYASNIEKRWKDMTTTERKRAFQNYLDYKYPKKKARQQQ